MIHFLVPASHDRLIREYLELWGRDVASRFDVMHTESLPSRTHFRRGTYVLAALDQHSSGMAAFVARLHDVLAANEGVRFLNHPTRTLQRFALLDTLHRLGRNDFRAFHATDDLSTLRFPVFVRDTATHDGALSPLLHTVTDVEGAIGRALVQGRNARTLMVVEFCDTADANGDYRKYSAFIIGRHIVPRYVTISREWMLKFRGGEFTPRGAEEERDYVLSNPHEAALRSVFDLANVEYGRIDYAMKGDRVQTWEINLNPTIGRGLRPSSGRIPGDVDAIRKTTKEHFYRRFWEAWEDVDVATPDGSSIAAVIDPEIVRGAVVDERSGDGWLSALRRVLRPAKPIIAPVVTRALPAIGRAAMRRARR